MKEPSQHTEDYLSAPVYTSKMSPQEFLQSKNEEAMGPVYKTPVSPQEFLETRRQVEMGPVYKSKMPPDQFIAMQEERVIYEMDPLIQNQIIYNRSTGDGGQFVLMADGQSYNVSSKGEFFRAPISDYDQQQIVKEAQEYFDKTHTAQGPTRTETHVPPAMMGGAGYTGYEYGVMTPPQVPDDIYYHDPTELSDTPMTKEALRSLYIEPYEDKEPIEKEFRYPTLRGAVGMSAGTFKETAPQPGKPLPGSLPLRGFMQLYGEYKRQTGHPGGADLVARVTGQPRGLGDSLQRALYDPKVIMEALPFVGRFAKSALLWNIKNRVRDNKATFWEHAILQQEAASQEQDVSVGGRAADISIPMPGFMVEMAIGSKLFGAAGPAFKGAKGMLVGGEATGATGRIYDAIVKKTGKELLGWTGSTVGRAAMQSATSSLPKSVAHALDRNAPVIGFRDDGSYGYIEDGEPLIKALFKGYLDEAVEVWSEQFGDMLLQLPGIRNLSEIEQGYLRRLAQKDGDGFLKRFAEGYTTLAGQTHFSTGILGQFAEHAEELTGDLLRYTFGLDDDYNLPSKDEWAAQTISFLLPGSVGVASTAHGVTVSKQARDFRRGQRISRSIDRQQTALKEEAERKGVSVEELRREQGIDPVVDIVTKRLPGVEVSEETTVDVGGREMTGRLVTRKDGVRMLITADETVGTPTTLEGKTNYLRSAAEMPGGGPVIALLREQASKAVESGDAALIESTFDTLYEELGGAKSTPGVSLTFLDSPNQKSVELTSLIRLADELDDTSKKITFDHELAHHLLKAFATEREWAMIEKGYLGPDGMVNEDIFANKYQMVARDRDLVMEHGSTMDKLMLRFRDWLDEIRDNVREFFGRGPTEYDVMRRMHRGELGAREMVSQEAMAERGAGPMPDMQAKEQAAAQWADTMAESVVAEDATTPVVKENLTTPTVKESLTVADDPAVAMPEGLADVGHPYNAPEYSVQSPIERFQKANKLPVGEQYAVVAHGTDATLQKEPGFPSGRLRLDYIGQGEGGQAYMWGIYLAQAMETGGVYRASVTNRRRMRDVRGDLTLNGKETSRRNIRALARKYSRQHNIDGYLYSTITEMLSEGMDKAEIESRIDLDKLDPADSIEAAALSFIVENNIELADKNIATGSLYTFDVPDAALERVILWDKSLGEQHEMVRPVLETAFKEWGIEYKGGAVGNAIHGTQLKRKAGSEWFREHGVIGNMYLDAGSRYKGEGTYNIVIWDQDVLNDVIPLTRNGEELSREGIAPERLESIRAQEADPDRQSSLAKANEMVPEMSLSTVYALGFATARSAVENIGGEMTTVDMSAVFGPTPAVIIPFENYDTDSRLINFLRDRNWLFYDRNTMIPYKERGITQGLDAQYESEYPGLRALETYFEVALYDRASGDFVGLINTGRFISDANKAILDKHGVTYREVEATPEYSVQPLLESSPSHSKGSTQAALRRSGAYSTNPITGQGTLNYSVSNFYQWKMGAYKEFNETVEAIKAIESKKNQTREDKKTLKELNKKLESLKELRDPKLVNALKALELSDKVIDAYFDWLESWYHQIKRFIEEHPDSIGSLYADTDKVATQGVAPSTRKAVKGTSGYMLSLDITGICAKRQDAQRFLEAVQDSLADQNKDSALTPIEQEMILLRLVQKGYERMCVVCYVETLRALKGKTAGNFIRFLMGEEFKKGDEGYIGSMSGERARGIREALRPEVEAGTLTYNDFDIRAITEEKGKDAALADPDHNIHKYPEAYKAAWDAANHNASAVLHSKPYEGNLRQLTQKQHDRMWITGGMRIFSQSDLLFEHLFDIIQALTDMSGRPAHNYTKEKWMPRVFGDTGLKMNLSLIGLFDKDGNMTPWNTNTYPWDDAFEMRKKHGDVGTILVALNDEAIYWGMNNDEIDQMIGFHASGMYTPQRKALERLTNIKNYEEGATVIIPEGAGLKYDDGTPVLEIKVPREQDAFFFSKEGEKRFQNDWGERFKGVPLVERSAIMSIGWVLEKDRGYTNQEILEAYLEAARKYQFIPQFARFVWDQETGELQPGAAKLIKDYARTDTPNRGVDTTKVNRDAIREMQAEWLDQKTNPSESRSAIEGKERALVDAMLKDIEYWRSKERSPENIQEMMDYLMQEQHGVALEGVTDADLSEDVPLPKQASADFAVTPEHMTPLERDIQEGKDSPGVPRLAIAEQSYPARTAAQNIDVAMYKDFESMPDTELQALADKVDLKELEPKVRAGEVLTAPETLAGIRLLEQSWQDYSRSGSLADMRRHIALHEGWRRGGTDLARRMRARADKLKTPQERFEHAMAMLHGKPSEKMKQLTERLGEEGISDADRAGLETQLEAELERMAAENARINDMLARYGLFAHEISKKLQTLNDNIDLLAEQLQQAEAERGSVAEAEEAASQAEAEIEKIKADHKKELERLRGERDKAQRRRRDAQRALNEARKDSNAQATQAARERAKKAEGDASRAERKAERAQAQLDEARKTNSDRIKEAERAARRAQAELKRTQKHLEKTAAAYEKAKNRIRELESDLVTAKRKEQQAKDALGRAREVYERQLNKAREARNKAQADLRNAKAREFRLEQKVIDLKSKLDDVRYRLRQAQRQAKDMIKGTFGAKTYTWGDVMYEYWLSGLLSGPRTHMVNTLSNVVHLAWDMGVQRMVEAAVNSIANKEGAATFGELAKMWRQMLPGLRIGLSNAREAFYTGEPVLQVQVREAKQEKEEGESTVGYSAEYRGSAAEAKLGRGIGSKMKLPSRMLQALDELTKGMIGHLEATALAYRAGLAEGIEGSDVSMDDWIQEQVADKSTELWDAVLDTALRLSFQTELGPRAKELSDVIGETQMKWLAPFRRTTTNIVTTGFRKTPWGLLSLAKRWNHLDNNNKVRLFSEQLMAWTIQAAMIATLVGNPDDEPWITGNIEYDSQKAGATGVERRLIKPRSIRIGGRWREYGRIEPFGIMLAHMADIAMGIRDYMQGKPGGDVLGDMISGQIDGILSIPMIQGLADFYRAAAGDVGDIDNWGTSFATSFVWNIVRQPLRSADPVYRDQTIPRGEHQLEQRLNHLIYSALPYGRHIPRFTPYGEEVRKVEGFSPLTDAVFRMLAPLPDVTPDYRDPVAWQVDKLLFRWNRENWDEPQNIWGPALPDHYIEFNGERHDLTDKQYEQLIRQGGAYTLDRLGKLSLNHDNPTERDVKRIKKAFENGYSKARNELRSEIRKAARGDR